MYTQKTQPVTRIPSIDLFKNLTQLEKAWFQARLRIKAFPAGCQVIAAQQPGSVVYIILQGTLRVHVEQLDGTDVILSILGPGEVFGEMNLIDSGGRSANVTTQEESVLMWMDEYSFREALEKFPAFALNLMGILSQRIRMTNAQIQALASLDVYGRVARQVMAFGERYGRPSGESGDIRIPIRLTQSDLSSLVGASRKRVNQVMVSFKNTGCLSVDENGHIIIHDPTTLRQAFEEVG